jgi:hypothetical protein
MSTLYQILGILAAGLLIWILWRTIKGRPELFSKAVINESARFMGYLALILIAFVVLLVFLARST